MINTRSPELSKLTYISGRKITGCRDLQLHSKRMILHCLSVKCSFHSMPEKKNNYFLPPPPLGRMKTDQNLKPILALAGTQKVDLGGVGVRYKSW